MSNIPGELPYWAKELKKIFERLDRLEEETKTNTRLINAILASVPMELHGKITAKYAAYKKEGGG
jgi:uncharacterized protein (UPF0335 family)